LADIDFIDGQRFDRQIRNFLVKILLMKYLDQKG